MYIYIYINIYKKLLIHLEKIKKKITKIERKKLEKLANHEYLRKLARERFDEHLDLFTFLSDLSNYCETFVQMLLI